MRTTPKRGQYESRVDWYIRRALDWIALAALAVGCTGCVGSLHTASDPQTARCQSLDSWHRIWGAVAMGSATATAGIGSGQLAAETSTRKDVLSGVTIGTGVVSASAAYLATDYATTWADEGCGK